MAGSINWAKISLWSNIIDLLLAAGKGMRTMVTRTFDGTLVVCAAEVDQLDLTNP